MDQRIRQLIEESTRKTRSKELKWTPTGAEDQYVRTFSTGAVMVDRYEGGAGFGIRILNKQGESIAEVGSSEEFDPDFEILKKLFLAAAESHLKVDETIAGILKDLGAE